MTIINLRQAVPLEKEELQEAESLRKALQERVKTSMLESQESHLQENVAWKLGTADGYLWSGEIIILDTEKEKGPLLAIKPTENEQTEGRTKEAQESAMEGYTDPLWLEDRKRGRETRGSSLDPGPLGEPAHQNSRFTQVRGTATELIVTT